MKYLLYFFLPVFLIIPEVVFSQGSLKGRITDQVSGKELSDAHIILKKTKTGTKSSESGTFIIENIAAGKYIIKVSFVGYNAFEKEIEIKEGQTSIENISLQPLVIETDAVVITATKIPQRIIDIPSRVDVIEQKQIENITMLNVDDLMKSVAGVYVSRGFGFVSSKAIVSLRGLGGKEQSRTLVLIDGIPVNKTDGGSVNWNLMNTDMVERIEIVKGPGSSLYGGNAMGGIINVISKKPEKPIQGKIQLRGGTYSTFGANIMLGGKILSKKKNNGSGIFWSLTSFGDYSKGYYSIDNDSIREADPTIVRTYMKDISAGASVGYDFNHQTSLTADFNYYNDLRGSGTKVYEKNGGYTGRETYQANLSFRMKKGIVDIKSAAFFQDEYYRAVNESYKDYSYRLYDVASNRRDFGLLFNINEKLSDNNTFSQGFDIRQGSVDAEDVYYTSTDLIKNAGKMNFYGIYLQDELRLLKNKFSILAGIRFDYSDYFDGLFEVIDPTAVTVFTQNFQDADIPSKSWYALSPKLSLQYKFFTDMRTYLSYGRGFRPPILDDMCRSGKIRGGFKIANPSLKPETLDNIEWGIDLAFLKKIFFNASLYYSIGHDFMYYVSTGDSIDMGYTPLSPVFIRKNVSNVELYGAEAELKYNILPSLDFYANYAFHFSRIKKYDVSDSLTNTDLTGKYLADVPTHTASAGISWRNKIVNISFDCQYIGSMYINDLNSTDEVIQSEKYPDYILCNMKIWRSFLKYFTLSANVKNIFNYQYYDTKNQVSQGRFIYGELTFRF